MNDTENPIKPSKGRQQAAARQGWFPRSKLFPLGLRLVLVAVLIKMAGAPFFSQVQAAFSGSLVNALVLKINPITQLTNGFLMGLKIIAPLLLVWFIVSFLIVFVPALIAKRYPGKTAVPVPPYKPFGTTTIISLFAMGVIALGCVVIFREHSGYLVMLMTHYPYPITPLVGFFTSLFAFSGVVLMLGAAADLSFQKIKIQTVLGLSRSEANRELRAQGGSVGQKRHLMSRSQ